MLCLQEGPRNVLWPKDELPQPHVPLTLWLGQELAPTTTVALQGECFGPPLTSCCRLQTPLGRAGHTHLCKGSSERVLRGLQTRQACLPEAEQPQDRTETPHREGGVQWKRHSARATGTGGHTCICPMTHRPRLERGVGAACGQPSPVPGRALKHGHHGYDQSPELKTKWRAWSQIRNGDLPRGGLGALVRVHAELLQAQVGTGYPPVCSRRGPPNARGAQGREEGALVAVGAGWRCTTGARGSGWAEAATVRKKSPGAGAEVWRQRGPRE